MVKSININGCCKSYENNILDPSLIIRSCFWNVEINHICQNVRDSYSFRRCYEASFGSSKAFLSGRCNMIYKVMNPDWLNGSLAHKTVLIK